MHLWLTCYFVRQRGRGCSPTDCSLSMLSEGYLIRSIKTTLKKGDPGLRIAARQAPRVCVEHREINASGRCIQVPSEGCTEATLILRKLPNPKLYTSTRTASKSQAPPLLQSFH